MTAQLEQLDLDSEKLEGAELTEPAFPLDFERNYTLKEFLLLDLPEDDYDYELLRGKLRVRKKGGLSAEHGKITGRLLQQLNNFLDAAPNLGLAYDQAACTLGVADPEASWVEPDVSFVAAGRTPAHFKGPLPVAPDFVIEVNSPTDTTEKIQEKMDTYLAAGVKLVWSVYLVSKFVIVYRLNETRRDLYGLSDVLDGGEVLPGFKLDVQKLFD